MRRDPFLLGFGRYNVGTGLLSVKTRRWVNGGFWSAEAFARASGSRVACSEPLTCVEASPEVGKVDPPQVCMCRQMRDRTGSGASPPLTLSYRTAA